MALKIDRSADGRRLILRLSGRMQSEHVEELKAQMGGSEQIVLDLEELKLVDRDVVRFLGVCERNGTELRHCSPYIREWIAKENNTQEAD